MLTAINAPEVSNAAALQTEPVQTKRLLLLVFQYKAPVRSALPSLSSVGAEALEPRKRSSNASYEAAALFPAVVPAFRAV